MKKTTYLALGILLLLSGCKPIGELLSDVFSPNGSISINAGAAYTNSSSVTLTLDGDDATQMYVTNTAGCESGGTWEAYSTTKSWTLGQTNATATVYVRFKDRSQNVSSCVSDAIVHDNTAPTGSISIAGGANYTNVASPYTVSLTLNASDTNLYEMYVTNSAGCGTGGNWVAYSSTINHNLGQNNSTATVYVKFRDYALNESSCVSDTIVHDNTAPTLDSLTPATGPVNPVPSTVVATFSEAMTNVATNKFAITGTCTAPPTVSQVTMSSGNTVATATLSGGTCTDGQTVIVTVNPANVTDAVGNAGTGGSVARTYTFVSNTCGDSGDGCYDDNSALNLGFAIVTDGNQNSPNPTFIEYRNADTNCTGGSCFKVWGQVGANSILNASGLWTNGGISDWQRKLNPSGVGSSSDYILAADIEKLEGRVCPGKTTGSGVFIGFNNMVDSIRCLYYDSGNAAQSLDAAGTSGTEASDWLQDWDRAATGRGTGSSYFEGNIKTCADKGMRLPTMYETTMPQPGATHLPTGDFITPTWAGFTNGVPSFTRPTSGTWTASAGLTGSTLGYWYWSGIASGITISGYFGSLLVRCVLP